MDLNGFQVIQVDQKGRLIQRAPRKLQSKTMRYSFYILSNTELCKNMGSVTSCLYQKFTTEPACRTLEAMHTRVTLLRYALWRVCKRVTTALTHLVAQFATSKPPFWLKMVITRTLLARSSTYFKLSSEMNLLTASQVDCSAKRPVVSNRNWKYLAVCKPVPSQPPPPSPRRPSRALSTSEPGCVSQVRTRSCRRLENQTGRGTYYLVKLSYAGYLNSLAGSSLRMHTYCTWPS